MNKNYEILDILTEECAEVIQAVSKIRRFGLDSDYKGETNQEHLQEELGDLLCMIRLAIKVGFVDESKLEYHSKMKLEKLRVWSKIDV